jgi:hypothetical protein
MLLKPVKQDYLLPQPRDDEPPPAIRQELGANSLAPRVRKPHSER